jgi:hypothetical protein
MLRIVIVLVLGAHGIGHLIGVAGGWFNSAWGGSNTSWLLTPPLGRATGALEGALWLLPGAGFVSPPGCSWVAPSCGGLWRSPQLRCR